MAVTAKVIDIDGLGRVERHSEQSGSGANLTMIVPSGVCRQILFATVVYSANSSTTVTMTLNSGVGAAWDTLIDTTTLSTATTVTFLPAYELILQDDDTFDVLAPLLASETSSIAVYSRAW